MNLILILEITQDCLLWLNSVLKKKFFKLIGISFWDWTIGDLTKLNK